MSVSGNQVGLSGFGANQAVISEKISEAAKSIQKGGIEAERKKEAEGLEGRTDKKVFESFAKAFKSKSDVGSRDMYSYGVCCEFDGMQFEGARANVLGVPVPTVAR